MPRTSSEVHRDIQKIVRSFILGIPETSWDRTIKACYRNNFSKPLVFDSLGVNTIAELLDVMHRKGMVFYHESPEDNERVVMCSVQLKSRQEDLMLRIQILLDEHGGSIPLDLFQAFYEDKFSLLDYDYYGLKDFDSLCKALNLVLSDDPESSVMSARTLKTRQKALKLNVQELLDEHGGSIPIDDFQVLYENKFKAKLDHRYFGLKIFEICKFLNLVVEANIQGVEVVKKAEKINSRKRKK